MRFLKHSLLVLIGLIVLLWLVRGSVYRKVVRYEVLRVRTVPVVAWKVDGSGSSTAFGIDEVISSALDSTADRLHFTTDRSSNDPLKLPAGSGANCIGYAAVFRSVFQGLAQREGLSERYSHDQVVAQLYMGKYNVHELFSSPFWKDHDIVRITDKNTGDHVYVDPTLYDAVGIGRVCGP